METFSERLKVAIIVSGMRQTDVARKSGISATAFCHFCNGNRKPSLENLAKLLPVLSGIDARWLICGDKK